MPTDKTVQNRTEKLLEIEARGKKKNWTLLSTVYNGHRDRVEFTCGVPEHKSFTVYAFDIERRRGCVICNPPPPYLTSALSEQKFRDTVEEKEGTIIGGTYSNGASIFDIVCVNGHEFKMKPKKILEGYWCHGCHMDKLKLESAQEFHREVIRRGGTCTDTYIDITTKLLIVCHSKHEFKMAPGCVKQGHFCRKCVNKCPAQAKENFETEVKKKEGILVGEYLDTHTRIKIRCKADHEFMMSPHNVKAGQWCPACFGSLPWQAAQKFYAKIKERGGTRIDDYVTNTTKARILCGQNHTFVAIPNSITNGRWCPICRESKGANEVRGILKALNLPYEPEYITPITGRCRYDFHVIHNGKHVFIEYDGEQHFRESFFTSGDDFLRARNRDIFKTRAVIQGYQCKLIRIDYKTREDGYNLKQFILDALNSPSLFVVSNLEMYSWLEIGLQSNQQLELPSEDVPYTEDDLEPASSPQAATETITTAFKLITIC